MPGSGSPDHGSAQERTWRSVQLSASEAAAASPVAFWVPAVQDWRRRRPSKTSTLQLCGPCRSAAGASVTLSWTVGVWPSAAANAQYR